MDFWGTSFCTVIGLAAGSILTHLQTRATINKLKSEKTKLDQEAIKCAGDNLAKLHIYRQAYDDACELCKQITLQLIEDMKTEALAGTRESLCTALCNKVIPNYINLIEWEHLMANKDPTKIKRLIEEDVISELRRFYEWTKIINSKLFIHKMKMIPLKVNKRTLEPFLGLINDLPNKDNNNTATLLRNAVSDIIKTGL